MGSRQNHVLPLFTSCLVLSCFLFSCLVSSFSFPSRSRLAMLILLFVYFHRSRNTMSIFSDAQNATGNSELFHFSELFEHSLGVVEWSPNGRFMATARKNRLVVRDMHSMEIVQLYTCLDGASSPHVFVLHDVVSESNCGLLPTYFCLLFVMFTSIASNRLFGMVIRFEVCFMRYF
jgi:hypothetical protein